MLDYDNNDLYRIKARVMNLARLATQSNIAPQGEMLINIYVHVLKSLYDFSETIKEEKIKLQLINLIKENEDMPAKFMAIAQPKLKNKKCIS